MQGSTSSLLLVGIKQEEVNTKEEEWVLRPYKEEVSRRGTVLDHRKHRRRRLYAEQGSIGSIGNDCISSGDEWKPSPASSHSPTGTPTPTIPSSVPTGDLNAPTCLFVPTKASDPRAYLEANTSGTQNSKVEEPTGEEPTHQLEGDRSLPLHEYTCEFCVKAFVTKWQLKKHVNDVHKNLRKFPCDICGVSFKKSGHVKSHVNAVHKNLRNFPCDICGYSFQYNTALKKHVDSVHKNLRKFPCNICGQSFTEKGTLKKHVNAVHKNIRKISCDICDASFHHTRDLNRHVDGVHKNVRNFPCDICGVSFQENGALKRHVHGVHKKRRAFLCAICGHAFKQNASLKKHLERFHPEGKQQKQENPS